MFLVPAPFVPNHDFGPISQPLILRTLAARTHLYQLRVEAAQDVDPIALRGDDRKVTSRPPTGRVRRRTILRMSAVSDRGHH